jgi:hypothetical protein
MVDVYSTEAERRAAIEEVTRLRREFDTTTAKGAKAFAADPEAQAALARLDAAKSAAGMRTAAEDLAFINKVDTGQKTDKQVTKALNQPSRQYFNQVTEAYSNPSIVPTWSPPKRVTPADITQQQEKGIDLTKARYDWVWYKKDEDDLGRWAIGLVGSKLVPPKNEFRPGIDDPVDYGLKWFASDSATISQWANFIQQNKPEGKINNLFAIAASVDEIAEALPDIKYSELQEIVYRLTLKNDTEITIEDILDMYDDLFGKG